MSMRPDAKKWHECYVIERQNKAKQEYKWARNLIDEAPGEARAYQIWASYHAELARIALIGLVYNDNG